MVQCWNLKLLAIEINLLIYKNIFLEVKCIIVQSSEANLKYDDTVAADLTNTDAPYFCNNVLHSLFSV